VAGSRTLPNPSRKHHDRKVLFNVLSRDAFRVDGSLILPDQLKQQSRQITPEPGSASLSSVVIRRNLLIPKSQAYLRRALQQWLYFRSLICERKS